MILNLIDVYEHGPLFIRKYRGSPIYRRMVDISMHTKCECDAKDFYRNWPEIPPIVLPIHVNENLLSLYTCQLIGSVNVPAQGDPVPTLQCCSNSYS